MMYTDVVKINQQAVVNGVPLNPKGIWRENKVSEGENIRWFRDPDGLVGYVYKSGAPGFLMCYPMSVAQKSFRFHLRRWDHDQWSQFEPAQ